MQDINPPNNDFIIGWLSGWFYPPAAILWKKEIFSKIGFWDENLYANQDGDLMLRALINKYNLVFSDSGEAYYRYQDNNKSISTNINDKKMFISRKRVLDKFYNQLDNSKDRKKYIRALGIAYHNIARNCYHLCIETAEECQKKCIKLTNSIAPTGNIIHRFLC